MNNISMTNEDFKELKDLMNQVTELMNRIEEKNQSTLEVKRENILSMLEEKDNEKVLKGFYLEPHINKAIDEMTKDKKRGSRSQLINDLLGQQLSKHDLL